MQGAQNVRSEAYLQVRRNDEGEAQSALGGQMDFLRSHQLRINRLPVGSPSEKIGLFNGPKNWFRNKARKKTPLIGKIIEYPMIKKLRRL
jgi:hypothetical protein